MEIRWKLQQAENHLIIDQFKEVLKLLNFFSVQLRIGMLSMVTLGVRELDAKGV